MGFAQDRTLLEQQGTQPAICRPQQDAPIDDIATKALGQGLDQTVHAVTGGRRKPYPHSFPLLTVFNPRLRLRHQVSLVIHLDTRHILGANLHQDILDLRHLLGTLMTVCINDVDQKIGLYRLLQGRFEGRNKFVRQA